LNQEKPKKNQTSQKSVKFGNASKPTQNNPTQILSQPQQYDSNNDEFLESDAEGGDNQIHSIQRSRIHINVANLFDKWGVTFSGKKDKLMVREFVDRIELIAKDHNVEDQEILKSIGVVLKEEAKEFYFIVKSNHNSWSSFKKALIDNFTPPAFNQKLLKKIYEFKQDRFQDFSSYALNMKKLIKQLPEKPSKDDEMKYVDPWNEKVLQKIDVGQR
jgi:hypothetical protein